MNPEQPIQEPNGLTIVVSGASGFLGMRLIKRLSLYGNKVIALARRWPNDDICADRDVDYIENDLCFEKPDFGNYPDIDAAIHLAGATSGAKLDEIGYLRANEQTTVQFCDSLSHRVGRIIYASSQAVYGNP